MISKGGTTHLSWREEGLFRNAFNGDRWVAVD